MAYEDAASIAALSTEELREIVTHRQDYTAAAIVAAETELAGRQVDARPSANPRATPAAAERTGHSIDFAIGFLLPLLVFVPIIVTYRRVDVEEFWCLLAGAELLVIVLGVRSWTTARFRAYALLVWMCVPAAFFFLSVQLWKLWTRRPKNPPRQFPKVSFSTLQLRAIGAYLGQLFFAAAVLAALDRWLPAFEHHGTGNDASAGLGAVVVFALGAVFVVGLLSTAIAGSLIYYLGWARPSAPFFAGAIGLAAAGATFLWCDFRPNLLALRIDAALTLIAIVASALLAERFARGGAEPGLSADF